MNIPSEHLPVMPYLIITNAKDFADFAKAVFGATEQLIVPTADGGIMHGELRIRNAVIMFAEASHNWKEKTAGMYIYVENVKEVYKAALNKGAKSLMQPEEKNYGFTAGFEDNFGNQWWIVEAESR